MKDKKNRRTPTRSPVALDDAPFAPAPRFDSSREPERTAAGMCAAHGHPCSFAAFTLPVGIRPSPRLSCGSLAFAPVHLLRDSPAYSPARHSRSCLEIFSALEHSRSAQIWNSCLIARLVMNSTDSHWKKAHNLTRRIRFGTNLSSSTLLNSQLGPRLVHYSAPRLQWRLRLHRHKRVCS
jgi:hypothetical protein